MRLIFSVLTAIVVLILGLIFVAPMFISTDDMRSELFARVEQMTGFRLRVSGPMDITVFPSLALVAEDVGVAQPTASGDKEFATAKKVRFDLLLTGLLQGKVRVREVTLVNPAIAVPQSTAAATKVPSPQMAPPADPPGVAPEAPAAPPAPEGSGMADFAEQLKSISLDKLIITNGTVTLPSSGGKPGTRVEQLNLKASLPGYDAPLTLDINAVVDRKAMQLAASIGNFGPFLGGATVPVRLTASLPGTLDAPVSLSGSASYKNETLTLPQFSAKSGDKTLSGSAIYKDGTATLSQLTGTFGRDTFAGKLVYKDNIVVINPLRANVRGTVLAGQVRADLSNKVPFVAAAFGAKTLDINRLTGGGKSAPSKAAGAKPAGGGGKKARSKKANAKKVGAKSGGGGNTWSNERIDFSPLRSVNANVNLRAEQLIYDQVKIAPVSLQVTLNGGKLNAKLAKFGLYGGAGNATVVVDASGKRPVQRVNASLQNFNGNAFLKDAAGMESIEGKGTVSLNLATSGVSQRAMVGALGGKASIEFANGAVRGVNIAKMIRNLGQGAVRGWQGTAAEKTDFASLGANFQINKGVAQTKDIHLVGPLVTVNGEGTVNLPRRALKLRVDPQLVASLEGQGRTQETSGLGVPVMIVGPWANPKIYPDIKGILENPAEAIARYKQFGKDLQSLPGIGGNAEALQGIVKDGKIDQDALVEGIGGLLGGNNAAQQPDTAANPDLEPVAPEATAAPLENVIKDGKVDQDALIQGIGGLLGGSEGTQDANGALEQEAVTPDNGPRTQKPNAKNKKKKKKLKAEDVGKQLLNNWLSGQ